MPWGWEATGDAVGLDGLGGNGGDAVGLERLGVLWA